MSRAPKRAPKQFFPTNIYRLRNTLKNLSIPLQIGAPQNSEYSSIPQNHDLFSSSKPFRPYCQKVSTALGQTKDSLQTRNNLFHRRLAIGQCKNRCIINPKLLTHNTSIRVDGCLRSLNLQQIISTNPIQYHFMTKDSTSEGAPDFQISLSRVKKVFCFIGSENYIFYLYV